MAVKPGNGGAGGGERDPRLDLLYRDTPRDAPPPHLDAAILAAARREVGARPRPLSAQFRRWRVPVSIAAVVVLSMSLVTLVKEEGGDTLLRDAPTPIPLPAQTEELSATPAGDRQRAPAAAPEVFSARPDERVAAKAYAKPERLEREASPDAGRAAEPSRNASAGAEADHKMAAPQVREAAPRPSADQSRPQAPPMAGERSAAGAAAPAPAPPAARRLQAEPSLAMKQVPVWQGLEQEPLGKWLERLTELRKQGRTGEADELLAEIKRRFPDQPLPSGQK
jgi:hypothetical protein